MFPMNGIVLVLVLVLMHRPAAAAAPAPALDTFIAKDVAAAGPAPSAAAEKLRTLLPTDKSRDAHILFYFFEIFFVFFYKLCNNR